MYTNISHLATESHAVCNHQILCTQPGHSTRNRPQSCKTAHLMYVMPMHSAFYVLEGFPEKSIAILECNVYSKYCKTA